MSGVWLEYYTLSRQARVQSYAGLFHPRCNARSCWEFFRPDSGKQGSDAGRR